jgi:hypothetical protein
MAKTETNAQLVRELWQRMSELRFQEVGPLFTDDFIFYGADAADTAAKAQSDWQPWLDAHFPFPMPAGEPSRSAA